MASTGKFLRDIRKIAKGEGLQIEFCPSPGHNKFRVWGPSIPNGAYLTTSQSPKNKEHALKNIRSDLQKLKKDPPSGKYTF